MWSSSELTSEKLGITEIKLSFLRENGILKPGIHWKSSPLGQKKPWKPKALYNVKMCREIINKFYSEENFDLKIYKIYSIRFSSLHSIRVFCKVGYKLIIFIYCFDFLYDFAAFL